MINLFRFSQVRALQGEGFKLGDALRLAYKDLYYTQYKKQDNIFDTVFISSVIAFPFVLIMFV